MDLLSSETGPAAEARARDWLAKGGLRPTRQRRALAMLLVGDGCNRHATAESLFEASRDADDPVSLATVYNTLRAFTAAGLLSEIAVDGARTHYDTCIEDHPHYYWEDDARLSDAPAGSVRFAELPTPPAGQEIAKVEVVIRLRGKTG